MKTKEQCAICGCTLHRTKNTYATPTVLGRSHATKHHFVAERFFGRSKNRQGTQRKPVFETCPWNLENETEVFCYECHEELLHNPIFLPEDIRTLARIVRIHGANESEKTESKALLAERVKILQRAISLGLESLEQSLRESLGNK